MGLNANTGGLSAAVRERACARRWNRRDFGKLALGLLATAGISCKSPRRSLLTAPPDAEFFRQQAQRVVGSAHVGAGQTVAGYHNPTPYDVHVPGGNMGYSAYWVRDGVMMLGGDFIPAKEIEGWIRLMCATLRGPEGWRVRPGIFVPAYAVPDHINFDGKATYFPGNYETGDKQGGHAWGHTPPLDDNFFFVTAVYEHWKLTGDLNLFRSALPTYSSQEKLAELCEKVYRMPATDHATGLVFADGDPEKNPKDWGFCDGVFKSGEFLFTSLLKFIAAKQLAEMFATSGDIAKAESYRNDAARISDALAPTFFHASPGGSEGWLHSATGVGNQPDVWGSAFAVFSGAVDDATEKKVSRALVRAFRERTAVREGCVRHILTTDPLNQGGWERTVIGLGTYQNGGYWGTPSGWYIAAMHKSDPAAAADMTKEYIRFLRSDMRPDGTSQAWEWFNPDTGARNNPLYVATVALPYVSLKKAELL